MKGSKTTEPTFAKACEWWDDLPNIWTPVGWRDHMFNFNVFWNGMILAEPANNRRTTKWQGQGLQLTFAPHYTDYHMAWRTSYLRHDDGMVRQGWNDGPAPVLWTEWAKDGLLLRQEIFAHVPGKTELRTGVEPLYAWVRLSIHDICPALPVEDVHGFNLIFNAPHISGGMSMRDNIHFYPERSKYPRRLRPARKTYDPASGYHVMESSGKVRLALAPGQKDCSKATFFPTAEDNPDPRLYVQLPARKGASVDVLVPMVPTARKQFDAVLARGYNGALKEVGQYWRGITRCSTRFEVPEAPLNEAIKHSVRFSNVLTERNPAKRKLCKVNGSWAYNNLWTTPGAMDLVMMMDALGHHSMVARYLDIFRDEQGTVKPPGDAYKRHPGYYSTPAAYKSIDWLSDNGAVLYTIASHALLSGNRAFIKRFTASIVKSCDWIKAARAKTGHGGYEGLLPPAVATDARTKIQAVWTIGWNYKGLITAIRLLKKIGHPRTAEFEEEARQYKTAFLKAFRDKCQQMPTWRDDKGKERRFVPTALAGDEKAESRHAFFLDTGALFLVLSGLMDASDPLMKDIRAWFRRGPQVPHYRRDSNCWQVPVLDHEMSSCEPCYSWNVFHTWQLGDRKRFLEGMYSQFAGAMSRRTWISCETRGGITGNVFAAPLAIYMARLAVIDDQLKEDELHLLRLTPLAWLKPGDACRFDKMPTEFGPVTLRTQVSDNGKVLDVHYEPAYRAAPAKVVLHVPPMPKLQTIRVNGKKVRAKGKKVAL